jgi:predicted phosphohydrolase
MRLHILSDLHLEMKDWTPQVRDAVVTPLAGDIHKRERGLAWTRAQFPGRVLLVAGNHELYGGHLRDTLSRLRAASCDRVQVLENDAVVIDGVRFLGATAWTDYRATGNTPLAQMTAFQRMNDFRRIRTANAPDAYVRIHPEDLVLRNGRTRLWLKEQLALPHDGPTVVIIHHAPSLQCLDAPSGKKASVSSTLDPFLDAAYVNAWEDMLGKVSRGR